MLNNTDNAVHALIHYYTACYEQQAVSGTIQAPLTAVLLFILS